jgi:hypothetical protein
MLTRPRSPRAAVLFPLLVLLPMGRAAHAAPTIRLWQSPNSAVSEGQVDVQASPAAIYAAMTDYPRWPSLFSDVEFTKLKGGGREDALLQFKSRTFGKPQVFRFRNVPNRVIRYELTDGPSGVKVMWEAWFEPTEPDTGTTRIRLRMYVHVGGIYGWIVSKKTVRKYRERKLERDLVDLGKRFATPAPKSVAAGK